MPKSIPVNFQLNAPTRFEDTVQYCNTVHLIITAKKQLSIIIGLYLLNRSTDLLEILHMPSYDIHLR